MSCKKILTSLAVVAMVGCQLLTPVTVEAAPARSVYQLFDAEYYAEQNPDVVAVYGTSKRALYRHFVYFGMEEGRNLSADFDVSAYRSAYPDLVDAYGDDISKYYQHYIVFGQSENRTLVTVDACKEAGVTVTDFDGNTIYTPYVYVPPVYIPSSSSSQVEDEYWLTGTWYNTELSDGPTTTQGPCPYEMYTLFENEDGSVYYYEYNGHGAWRDGEFDYNAFNVSQYSELGSAVRGEMSTYFRSMVDNDTCFNHHGDSTPIGLYDEGCVHMWTWVFEGGEHTWEDGRCTRCMYYCTHGDEDVDALCDYCGNELS